MQPGAVGGSQPRIDARRKARRWWAAGKRCITHKANGLGDAQTHQKGVRFVIGLPYRASYQLRSWKAARAAHTATARAIALTQTNNL
jgi:hypothetical protein